MMICLVTDRRRLSSSDSFPVLKSCLLDQIRCATEAGIDLVQIREGDLPASDLRGLVRDALSISRGSTTRVVVNERLDIALACEAHGVHLRADSMPAERVRELAPSGFLVGRSVHGVEEAGRAGPVDYLIAGTVFETGSKPLKMGRALLGIDGLAAIVRAAHAPVMAIGGMTDERVTRIAATGAAGVAAIGLFIGPADPQPSGCRAVPLIALVQRIRERFDTPERAL